MTEQVEAGVLDTASHPQSLMPTHQPTRIPAAIRDRYDEIVALTDRYCAEHLASDPAIADEVAGLARKLAACLARKKDTPLDRGHVSSWAAGVMHAVARVNFMFDHQAPHRLIAKDLSIWFGLGATTSAAKARQIDTLLSIREADDRFACPALRDANPWRKLQRIAPALFGFRRARRI